MYAIYGNIYHQYTPNVSIYTIHGSYGPCLVRAWLMIHIIFNCVRTALAAIVHLDQARKHRGGSAAACGKVAMVTSLGIDLDGSSQVHCQMLAKGCFSFYLLWLWWLSPVMSRHSFNWTVREAAAMSRRTSRSFKLFWNGSIAVWSPHKPQYCHIEI